MRKRVKFIFYLLICTGILFTGQIQAQSSYALSLPGGSDGNASNVAIPALSITSLPVTVEMWYKPDATQNYYCTLWYTRGASNNSGVQYDRWTDVTKIKGVWNGTAGTGLSTVKPVAGQWNHVALVVTPSNKTLYINGVAFDQTGTYTNFPFDAITYLGWDAAVANRTLKGLIDEVRIWSVARTAQELQDNKFVKLTGSETGLVAYYKFDDKATAATNSSSNGSPLNGTIHGGDYVASFDNAKLSNITLSKGSLDKTFNLDSTSYKATLPPGTTSVTVSATTLESSATILKGTGTIDVSSGNTKDTITVTAFDGITKKSYIVEFIVPLLSSDATLKTLSINKGSLNPIFNASVTTYEVKLPAGITSVNVSATTNYKNATFTGAGAIDVSSGSSTAIVKVTAEDGVTTKSYTINFSYEDGNYAISLPGTDGNSSNIDISGLNLATLPYTIEMWIKPACKQTDNTGLIYHRGTGNSGLQYSSSWQVSGKLRFMTNINNDYGTVTDSVTTNEWHHVAVVLTSTTRTVYLDDKVYTQTISNGNYDFTPGKLYIGWDNAAANRAFKGEIDEVRIWKTARTASEIATNQCSVLTGSETGLAGYWNFDEHNQSQATDWTGNGLHGIIHGGTLVPSSPFIPMAFINAGVYQKSSEVNSPSLNSEAARLKIVTINRKDSLTLARLYLNATGTTSLANIDSVKIYYTGKDSVFNASNRIAALGTPLAATFAVNCNRKLAEGANYFWVTYNIAKNVSKGNILNAGCDSFLLAGSVPKTYIPSNANPSGQLTINPGLFMPYVKLPLEVVTSQGQTPAGGANFVSFQQNGIITYNGYQYVAYWNNAFRVCLARKKLPSGAWQSIEFPDHTVTAARISDGHYSISMGICPNDGTIHVAFDHHGDTLHYKKSIIGLANKPESFSWAASSFGAKQNYLIAGKVMTLVTYPRFVIKPNGDLLYEDRYGTSGAGDSYLYEYSSATGTWSEIGKYIDGLTLNNNAYLNGIYYDQNARLHASWVWRETPDPLTNHDVCYMYSDDHGRTWKGSDGTQVGTAATSPVNSNTAGIKIWSIGQNRGLINQESEAVDSKGGVHILQSYMLDNESSSTNFWNDRAAKAYLHHIYKDENGVWQNDVIDAIVKDRSKIAVDEGDNLYVVAPNYRIYYASAAEKWKKWTVLDISQNNSAINEGLIDREMLLNESVLSFAFAQTGGKIIVPYYLIDKSKPGKGTGLNTIVYGGSDFNTCLGQKLGAVNLTSGDITYSGDSVSIRSLGTLETIYAEAYTLQFTTSGAAKVWINDSLVLSTGAVTSATTFPITLKLQPSHRYKVKVEGKYATASMVTKLEWESNRQTRELVPLTALYGEPISTISSLSTLAVNSSKITGFASDILSYTVTLPAGTTKVPAVTGIATDAKCTIKITTAGALPGTTTVLVTAEYGVSTTIYKVNFVVAKSTVATLSDLTVNGSKVAGFATGTLAYNVELPAGTTTIPIVTGTSTDINASLAVTSPTSLPGTTIIGVTAEAGNTQTYTINFTVAVPPTGITTLNSVAVNVFPTITNNSFNVTTDGKQGIVTVVDIHGKVISKHTIILPVQAIEIDAAGIYFVRVECQNVVKIFKVVKTN
jgi:hypothetical protein